MKKLISTSFIIMGVYASVNAQSAETNKEVSESITGSRIEIPISLNETRDHEFSEIELINSRKSIKPIYYGKETSTTNSGFNESPIAYLESSNRWEDSLFEIE